MASITIHDENRTIEDVEEIRAYLEPHGIWYEKWDVEGRLGASATGEDATGEDATGEDATNEQILETYAPEIERLKAAGQFVTADVINVTPETPGLDDMLAKFDKEHTHDEDEVRFTVKGAGIFHIHPENGGPVFSVLVESGDLINVPRGTKHWFTLCNDRQIRCIRLFQDPAGWTPHYEAEGVHARYSPLCWGPRYVNADAGGASAVQI